MEIGIGLPSTIPGAEGRSILNWARHAEDRHFSTLGVLDRIVYDNYEPLSVLAAAGAVTERIRLTTSILLAPLRTNPTLFAKHAASLDRLCQGRLVLGLGIGRRPDDYTSCDVDYSRRGEHFDALLERTRALWRAQSQSDIGPSPLTPGGPPVIIGGASDAAYQRVARHGDGWIAGGGMGDVFHAGAAAVKKAWAAANRPGAPRIVALGYFSLGDHARESADRYLQHYYGFLGPGAAQVAAGALISTEQIAARIAEFSEAGCDELILFPCDLDPIQVDLLADAVGL